MATAHCTLESEVLSTDTEFREPGEGVTITQMEAFQGLEYHPPIVGQNDEWMEKTWEDMPGKDVDVQKLNFFLFRRGLYDVDARHQRDSVSLGFVRRGQQARDEVRRDIHVSRASLGEGVAA